MKYYMSAINFEKSMNTISRQGMYTLEEVYALIIEDQNRTKKEGFALCNGEFNEDPAYLKRNKHGVYIRKNANMRNISFISIDIDGIDEGYEACFSKFKWYCFVYETFSSKLGTNKSRIRLFIPLKRPIIGDTAFLIHNYKQAVDKCKKEIRYFFEGFNPQIDTGCEDIARLSFSYVRANPENHLKIGVLKGLIYTNILTKPPETIAQRQTSFTYKGAPQDKDELILRVLQKIIANTFKTGDNFIISQHIINRHQKMFIIISNFGSILTLESIKSISFLNAFFNQFRLASETIYIERTITAATTPPILSVCSKIWVESLYSKVGIE